MTSRPNIRFEGYTDDWEQRKLGEVTTLKSASRVHREEWKESGVPFYRSSDVMSAINGTENEKAFISEELYEKLSSVSGKLEEGDVLVTGGGSVGNPYIVPDNKPLYTKDADLLWIKNQGRFDAYFIYEFFFSPTFRSYLGSVSHVGTIAHYTITQLSETPVALPSLEEQKKIGDYFKSLDNLITLHQRKCDETKELKKYMLQKMFPKNGKKRPEIRFEGFNDDWEQRKLMEISDIITGTTPPTKDKDNYGGNRLFVSPADIQGNRYVDGTITTLTEKGYALGRELRAGTTLFVSIGSTIGKVAQIKESATTNQQINAVIPYSEMDDNFVFTMLENEADKIKKLAATQAVPIINKTTFGETEIQFPKKEEQTRIGEYFSNLDNLITLHQRKCDQLKEVKKFMLQNMFPGRD